MVLSDHSPSLLSLELKLMLEKWAKTASWLALWCAHCLTLRQLSHPTQAHLLTDIATFSRRFFLHQSSANIISQTQQQDILMGAHLQLRGAPSHDRRLWNVEKLKLIRPQSKNIWESFNHLIILPEDQVGRLSRDRPDYRYSRPNFHSCCKHWNRTPEAASSRLCLNLE